MEENIIVLNPMLAVLDEEPVVCQPLFATEYFREALGYNGITNVSFMPEQNLMLEHLSESKQILLDDLKKALKPGKMNILATTAMAENWIGNYLLTEQTRIYAQSKGLDFMAVVGGPYIKRTGVDDTVELFLYRDEKMNSFAFDGAVVGGLQAFLELIMAVRNETLEKTDHHFPKKLPRGYYHYSKEGQLIFGEGFSKNPELGRLPVYLKQDPGLVRLVTMFSNRCSCACDFCDNGCKLGFSLEQIAKGAKEVRSKTSGDVSRGTLQIHDSNPLLPAYRNYTVDGFKIFADVFGHSDMNGFAKNVFYDPGLMVDPAYALRDIIELNLGQIFIGRDAVTEAQATFIGSRFLGELKDQRQLDRERDGIRKVVELTSERDIYFTLSYILTPQDSPQDVQATLDEMDSFSSYPQVETSLCFLTPLIGSKLYSRHKALFSEDVLISENPWLQWNPDKVMANYPRSAFRAVLNSNFAKLGKQVCYEPKLREDLVKSITEGA